MSYDIIINTSDHFRLKCENPYWAYGGSMYFAEGIADSISAIYKTFAVDRNSRDHLEMAFVFLQDKVPVDVSSLDHFIKSCK